MHAWAKKAGPLKSHRAEGVLSLPGAQCRTSVNCTTSTSSYCPTRQMGDKGRVCGNAPNAQGASTLPDTFPRSPPTRVESGNLYTLPGGAPGTRSFRSVMLSQELLCVPFLTCTGEVSWEPFFHRKDVTNILPMQKFSSEIKIK